MLGVWNVHKDMVLLQIEFSRFLLFFKQSGRHCELFFNPFKFDNITVHADIIVNSHYYSYRGYWRFLKFLDKIKI